MAKSRFEYVKQFELDDRFLPNCWPVVRIDGKNFHRFCTAHNFVKPNDERALGLMSRSAMRVMEEFKDVILAYGQSDEYSFVLRKASNLFNRRGSKIVTTIVSLFASSFVFYWPRYFTQKMEYPPAFDSRLVCYPSDQNLRDYLSWRQADCHINNLYNTCFYKLVESGRSHAQAQEDLKGTLSADKNELLFAKFNINYNNLPEIFRKGTVIIRAKTEENDTKPSRTGASELAEVKANLQVFHCDIIRDEFWSENPQLLGGR